jgi:hypothetical protein
MSDSFPNLIQSAIDYDEMSEASNVVFKNLMDIKYEQNIDFKACPFHVDMNFNKPLQIVANFPLINEM